MSRPARFIHTSDWQVGRVFRFADDVTLGVLADARLEAIGRIAEVARAEEVRAVLVAGDVYEFERPSERTLRQPIERMAGYPAIAWHLIPGNHDPHRPGGVWERLARAGLPSNVSVHVEGGPANAGDFWLLPAVLRERHASGDPTHAFDTMTTPDGEVRVGLAHGSVRGFGDGDAGHNRIAPDRASRSGLDYLALGDWHGAQEAAARTWYSGTPEIDDFGVGGNGGGEVLVVRIDGPGAMPRVDAHRVGRFAWHRVEQRLFGGDGIASLEARIRGLAPALDRLLVCLTVSGSLTLADMLSFDTRIAEHLAAALRLLRVDRNGLQVRADVADLETIEAAGPIREAAERLAAAAADGNETAASALLRLVHLARKVQAEAG